MKKILILIWLLTYSLAHSFQSQPSINEMLMQADIVIIGKLTNVEEWIVDDVAYGEGVIHVTNALRGAVPDSKKVTLRWANNIYKSEAVKFADTKGAQFVWFLSKAQDGSYRAHYSSCQTSLTEEKVILAAIQKRKEAEQTMDINRP